MMWLLPPRSISSYPSEVAEVEWGLSSTLPVPAQLPVHRARGFFWLWDMKCLFCALIFMLAEAWAGCAAFYRFMARGKFRSYTADYSSNDKAGSFDSSVSGIPDQPTVSTFLSLSLFWQRQIDSHDLVLQKSGASQGLCLALKTCKEALWTQVPGQREKLGLCGPEASCLRAHHSPPLYDSLW